MSAADAPPNALVIVAATAALPAPVVLRPAENAVVGRGRDCRVLLGAETVSKHHAELRCDDGVWFLKDLGSRHGTRVNGWRLEPDVPVTLRSGDVLELADCRLQVRVARGPEAPAVRHSGTYATNPSIFGHLRGADTRERELGWEELRRRYAPVVIGYARNAGLPAQDAEDVLQEVMLGLVRALPTFRYEPQRGRFRGYLKRATLNAIRGRARPPETARTLPEPLLDERGEAAETAWEGHWAEQILARALEEARSRLDPRTFEAFDLYARRQVPVDEVAARLGLSRDSVYQARTRALKVVEAVARRLRDEEG